METIRFWYTFEDEDGDMPKTDVDISIEGDGLHRDEVCEAFERFLTAAGYSTAGLSEMFEN